jgi:hypothetical protein
VGKTKDNHEKMSSYSPFACFPRGFVGEQAHYSENLWWYVWEIPVFVAMGITQGCVGALFVNANKRLSLWRMRYVPTSRPWRRLAEVSGTHTAMQKMQIVILVFGTS